MEAAERTISRLNPPTTILDASRGPTLPSKKVAAIPTPRLIHTGSPYRVSPTDSSMGTTPFMAPSSSVSRPPFSLFTVMNLRPTINPMATMTKNSGDWTLSQVLMGKPERVTAIIVVEEMGFVQ